MKIKIKVCCIKSIEEADLAIQMGASAIGLVSEMPSGPGVISEELAAQISAAIPTGINKFLLTSKEESDSIISQQRRVGADTLQLCNQLSLAQYEELRRAIPRVSLVQVLHVLGEETLEEALRIGPNVDGILLDSGNPNAPVKELGGTGRVHNWEISKKIVEAVKTPVFLAGGLNANNIRDAIHVVRPFGVDVCSGVRTDGNLDRKKLSAFFEAIRSLQT